MSNEFKAHLEEFLVAYRALCEGYDRIFSTRGSDGILVDFLGRDKSKLDRHIADIRDNTLAHSFRSLP